MDGLNSKEEEKVKREKQEQVEEEEKPQQKRFCGDPTARPLVPAHAPGNWHRPMEPPPPAREGDPLPEPKEEPPAPKEVPPSMF